MPSEPPTGAAAAVTVERSLGKPAYLRLYAAAVLSAALVQLIVSTASSDSGPHATVGASGGVFGILLAFGMLFPRRWVVPLFPPIPLRAWLFVLIYGGIELVNGVLGTSAGVAHFAHLGGMLACSAPTCCCGVGGASAPPNRFHTSLTLWIYPVVFMFPVDEPALDVATMSVRGASAREDEL